MIPRFFHLLYHLRGRLGAIFWTLIARLRLACAGASVGPGLVVNGPIFLRVHPRGTLRIGTNCRFNSGFSNNPVAGHRRLSIWVGSGASLTIGDGAGLSNCTLVAMCQVEVGEEARIGGGVAVYDTDFHSLDPEARLSSPDKTVKKAPVLIGRRTFVGGHSILLKGSSLGEESVLGAGSVLTAKVPSQEIWAGNPAVFRKQLLQPK